MISNYEAKKAEAIGRMMNMGVFAPMIKEFADTGKIQVSEPPFGAWYFADEEDIKRAKEFEEEYDALVFMIVRSYTSIGKMDSFLYVCKYEEEWENEREYLKDGEAVAWVYNYDYPDCSEIGYIGLKTTFAAGVVRTY